MKFLILIALVLSFAFMTQASFADNSSDPCANWVASAVQARTRIDFPGQDLSVVSPDLGGWDGGSVEPLDVQVVKKADSSQVVAVYEVTIDETCSLIYGPDLKH